MQQCIKRLSSLFLSDSTMYDGSDLQSSSYATYMQVMIPSWRDLSKSIKRMVTMHLQQFTFVEDLILEKQQWADIVFN